MSKRFEMTLSEIAREINGEILTIPNHEDQFHFCFSSDLMSDVLTTRESNLALVTGLYNPQAIRAAEIADISCIIFVRNKEIPKELVALATDLGIGIIKTSYSMFHCSAVLYNAGLKPVY